MPNLAIDIDPSGARTGAKVVRRELTLIKGGERGTERAVDRLGNSSQAAMVKSAKSAGIFTTAMRVAKVAALALGTAVVTAAALGFRSAKGLDAALGEASTLLEGTTEEMALMRKEAQAMVSQFGGSTTQQVEAFYQAISAGAGSVEEATKLLNTANQLAKGGVTDITTAVDVLTTATNAYAASGLTAASASDTLFAGVKAGKTTVAELGSALGKIVPIASQLGVSFEDVVAATASLTLNGLSTAEAVTGLRGALSAVLKPTKEAADEAARLGLEFGVAALDQGFIPFLQDVIDKTEGNTESFAKLFGSVEGLGAVLALAANDGQKFVAVSEAVKDSLGATQEAADKISDSLSDRLSVAAGKWVLIAERMGTVLLATVVPVFEAFNAVIFGTFGLIGSLLGVNKELTTSQEQLDLAVDNAVVSLGDELRQTQLLATAIAGGTVLSVDAAEKKLQEAKARLTNVTAIIAEQRALAVGSDGFQTARQDLLNAQTALRTISTGRIGDDAREAQEQAAVNALNTMSKILEVNTDLRKQIEASGQNVDDLISGLANARDGLVGLGEGFTDPIEGSEQLKRSISGAGDQITKMKNDALEATKSIAVSMEDLSGRIADSFGQGVLDAVKGTQTIAGAFKNMAGLIIEELFKILVVEQAVASLKSIAGSFSISGNSSAFDGLFGGPGLGSFSGNANGNAFLGGNVIPFASGGIVSSPTLFPMSGGTGLMGEAGPEAIIPLHRGSDGKLGIKSTGGGGASTVNQNITINAMSDGDIDRVLARRMPQLKNMAIAALREERGRGGF